MHGGILAGKYRRWLVEMVGQSDDRLGIVNTRPIGVACLWLGQDTSSEREGGPGENRWPCRDELPVEESDLGDVESHVLNFSVVRSFREGNLKKRIDCGVTDDPVEGLQDAPFHLSELLVIV